VKGIADRVTRRRASGGDGGVWTHQPKLDRNGARCRVRDLLWNGEGVDSPWSAIAEAIVLVFKLLHAADA
jgi:hypothetical protein